MPVTMIHIGAYNPSRTAETVSPFGPPQAVSAANNEDQKSDKTKEKTASEQGQAAVAADKLDLSREALDIRELQMRDREVRAHEAAHAAAGGSYAGSPNYSYERGPDGRTYVVGGSVSIDMSPIQGDPQATLQKAQQIRSAALAPAQPSAQDMKVAQKAQAMAAQARSEMSQDQMAERERQTNPEELKPPGYFVEQGMSAYSRGISDPGPARLEIYS